MIGNNSSGSHSIVYGTTIDHVDELEVVLSDGSQAHVRAGERGRARPPRAGGHARGRGSTASCRRSCATTRARSPRTTRSTGASPAATGSTALAREFDLAKLVTGSEGTLAAITEARVGLIELPTARQFVVGHFEAVDEAVAATQDALDLEPAAVEMIDATILELSRSKREYAQMASRIEGEPGALLYVTFFGEEAGERIDRLEAAWREHGHGYHTIRAETAAEQAALTKVRKAGLGLLMAASEGARRPAAFVEDTAVPPERLGDYVKAFRAILDRHGLEAGWYGHASVGCLHVRPFVDLTRPGGVETMAAVADEISALVAEYDGVNASEHGDGRVRSPFNPRVFGDDLYEAFREVKALFDPDNRLNPGVMVDAAPITVGPARPRAPARAAAAHPLRVRGRDAHAPPTAASASAPAARPARASCARPTWPRARRSTPPAGAPTRWSRRSPSRIRAPRWATSGCTRSSTSASSARRARASAR